MSQATDPPGPDALVHPDGLFDLSLIPGLTVTVKPLTTAAMEIARAAARRSLQRLEADLQAMRDAGLDSENQPDLADEPIREGLFHGLVIAELAVRHITAWTRSEAVGAPLPITRDAVVDLVQQYPIGELFYLKFTAAQIALVATKKRTAARVRWHFTRGGGPDYCRDCRNLNTPCSRDGSCPYDLNAPQSLTEQQAWEVLIACRNQLRVTGLGQVLGLDLGTVLAVAGALGLRSPVLTELLVAADDGVMQAITEQAEDVDFDDR